MTTTFLVGTSTSSSYMYTVHSLRLVLHKAQFLASQNANSKFLRLEMQSNSVTCITSAFDTPSQKKFVPYPICASLQQRIIGSPRTTSETRNSFVTLFQPVCFFLTSAIFSCINVLNLCDRQLIQSCDQIKNSICRPPTKKNYSP